MRPVVALHQDAHASRAAVILAGDRGRSILVINDEDKAVGSVSLADLVRLMADGPRRAERARESAYGHFQEATDLSKSVLKEIMAQDVMKVSTETSVDELLEIFRGRWHDVVFVFEDDQPLGVIRPIDVLNALTDVEHTSISSTVPARSKEADQDDASDLGIGSPLGASNVDDAGRSRELFQLLDEAFNYRQQLGGKNESRS